MVSRHWFNNRSFKVLSLLAAFAVILYLATFLDGAYENYHQRQHELTLKAAYRLPIREISGLAWSHGFSQQLVAVGDHTAKLGLTHLDPETFALTSPQEQDFSKALLDQFAVCDSPQIMECQKLVRHLTSQWEAVAVDGIGQVFLMHEKFGSIFVLDPSLQQVRSVINLEAFELVPSKVRRPIGEDGGNSQGEGFLLLKNGHVLVAKEKEQPALIEFGPSGELAQGYKPEFVLTDADTFPVTVPRMKMVPLKIWHAPRLPQYRGCDISELAVNKTGTMYLLSQSCQFIGQLRELTLEDSAFDFVTTWSLPRALKHAEALVVLDERRFLVAEDKPSKTANNLFLLEITQKETVALNTSP